MLRGFSSPRSPSRRRFMAGMATLAAMGHPVARATAATAAAERWHVVCGEDFAPYVWAEAGQVFGLDVEICEKVLARLGVAPDITPMPWPRAVATLEAGAADLLLQFVATEERFGQFIMVGPFRNGETVFAVRADSTLRFDGLEDLRGLTIGTSRGFSYSQGFDEATDFIREPAATARLSLRKLVSGRVDMVVGDHIALAWLARRENIFERIRFLPRPLSTVPRYFGFPQDRAEKAARFEQALRELQVDGTIPALIDRWRETG